MKRVLIVGANSYIGDNIAAYLKWWQDDYSVFIIDSIGWNPKISDFKDFDVVIYVAGIAHRKETRANAHLYYEINRDLTIRVGELAKSAGVKQFIIMSSMSVYGLTVGEIKKNTKPAPKSHYGKSKLQADRAVWKIHENEFRVAVLRPPMVYGEGCKGNYQRIRTFALKAPIFPDYQNQRSMVYIGNLCWFIKEVIDQNKQGLFFPQNSDYMNTRDMVRTIAECHKKNVIFTRAFNFLIKTVPLNIIRKVFGNLTYVLVDTIDKYAVYDSIRLTEGVLVNERFPKISDSFDDEKSTDRKKKALCIASVASNLDNFNRTNVEILRSLGYDITLAANFHTTEDINSQEKIEAFVDEMRVRGINIVQVDFSRSPKNVKMQLKSIRQVRELLARRFDIIHCHSPICAAIVRAEAQRYRKKYRCKVIYTAHGFHFYKDAPIQNWLLIYPVEKLMSRYTDVLITINDEDYGRAGKKLYAKQTVYIPGIGIDTDKFKPDFDIRRKKRKELGIREDEIFLLSVGELNVNKNHELAIRALLELKRKNAISGIHYFICGQGGLRLYLTEMIKTQGLKEQVHIIGYRKDVDEIYKAADVFLFMSKREGLPVSLMEAMSSGLPAICTDTRGNRDLIQNGHSGFICEFNVNEIADRIQFLTSDAGARRKMGENARTVAKRYDTRIVKEKMKKIYGALTTR